MKTRTLKIKDKILRSLKFVLALVVIMIIVIGLVGVVGQLKSVWENIFGSNSWDLGAQLLCFLLVVLSSLIVLGFICFMEMLGARFFQERNPSLNIIIKFLVGLAMFLLFLVLILPLFVFMCLYCGYEAYKYLYCRLMKSNQDHSFCI